MVVVTTEHEGKLFFAYAHIRCDACGAQSEQQGACGAGAKDDACRSAEAHAAVVQGWAHVYEPCGKRQTMRRDRCPACMAKAVA